MVGRGVSIYICSRGWPWRYTYGICRSLMLTAGISAGPAMLGWVLPQMLW